IHILARAPGGQMRGAATKSMSDIVEERQQSRCPPAAAPLRAAARRTAGFVARSSHTAPGIARRSRLASGPGGLQQNVKLFLREPLALPTQFGAQALACRECELRRQPKSRTPNLTYSLLRFPVARLALSSGFGLLQGSADCSLKAATQTFPEG